MVKTFQDGIHVLYESLSAGRQRSRADFLSYGGALDFLVHNRDPSFFNYTAALEVDIAGSYFFFSNNQDLPKQEQGLLHQSRFAGHTDLRRTADDQDAFFAKPFALIHIELRQDLEKSFEIAFAGAATYWCYLLTAPHLQELASPAIIFKDTREAFTGPEPVRLPEGNTALAFFSATPIPHRERPTTTLQLVEDYDPQTLTWKVVLPALPGPDPQYISSFKPLAEQKGKFFSCIFI